MKKCKQKSCYCKERINFIKIIFMKTANIYTLLFHPFTLVICICFITSCTPPYERQCIKYQDNEDTTCTPAHDLLANKTWTFDSAFLNEQNISADCFAKGDTVRYIIGDENVSGYSYAVLYAMRVVTNDTAFAFVANLNTDGCDRPLVDTLFRIAPNSSLGGYSGRPLVFGLIPPYGAVDKVVIKKLTNKILKLQYNNKIGDTVLTNYFSIH
jgi:hypothetical protein